MVIKQIEKVGGASNKLRILLDNDEKLTVSAFIFSDFSLCTGKDMSDTELNLLRAAIQKEQTRQRAVRMISQSALSERLLKERLIAKGAAEQDAEDTVSWLHELNLTDDEKTAMLIVASAARKGYGRKRAEALLYEKKIPKQYWQQALDTLPQMDEKIDEFLHRRLDGKELDDKLVRKTVDALLRRGHAYRDVYDAIRRYRQDIELEQTDMEELP